MLLCEFQLNIDGKSCMLLLLRFSEKEDKNTSRMDQREELRSSQPSMTEPSRRKSHIFCLPKVMKEEVRTKTLKTAQKPRRRAETEDHLMNALGR